MKQVEVKTTISESVSNSRSAIERGPSMTKLSKRMLHQASNSLIDFTELPQDLSIKGSLKNIKVTRGSVDNKNTTITVAESVNNFGVKGSFKPGRKLAQKN